MAIAPDTKDWTWVLSRPCPECGFDARAVPTDQLAPRLRDNAAQWLAVLRRPDVRRRPAPERWSPLEYACHVRDVCVRYLERLNRMLAENDPLFQNWDQDATAIDSRYDEQEPGMVASELAPAAAAMAERLDEIEGPGWQRPGRRSDGATFTAEGLSRYFLHDLVHHVWDVRESDGYVGDPAVQAEWDERYADKQQLWSGQPNGALVAEVAGLTPGRALDVGCGEGADAVWLARGGWDVTAVEVSGVALARAAGHARDADVVVRWVHAGIAEAALPPGSFDLVSAQYPALLRTPDAASERALLAAVAPGGLLLFVHHAGMDTHPAHDDGPDVADYVWPPSMIAALLDDDWEIEVDEQRSRIIPESGAGAHDRDDLVLRARRLR